MSKGTTKQLVVCVGDDGYAVSPELRKIYMALRDASAEKHGLLRVIDESGEGYLCPRGFLPAISLPQTVKKAVLAAV
ncbi:MAG: hypothetical protein WDN03_15400 [Rhizomicrobium sp.]